MKIKFVAYWNTDFNIYSFVNDIWNYDHKYDDILTYNNDYTHMVVLNKINKPFDKKNTYGIILEPSWSPNYDKDLPNKCVKVITCETEYHNNSIFYPNIGTHRLYDAHYHGEIIYKKDTTKNILETIFPKSKKLSIIINYHIESEKQKKECPQTLYWERENLVKKLISSDINFDMYGQDWNINDRRYKGFLPNKLNGLKDYEYTISLENASISGWVTEKVIDPILCNTIPIYNGHPDIFKHYSNCCEYLEYDGNEINRIKEIISNNKTYKDYEFEKAKEKYFIEYNPIRIIKNLIENEC